MAPLLRVAVGLVGLGGVLSDSVSPGGPSGKLNVHLVCHTHDDAGWLKVTTVYKRRYQGHSNLETVHSITTQ